MKTELSLLLHTPQQKLAMLVRGPDNPKIALAHRNLNPVQYMVPQVHKCHPPEAISISSAVFFSQYICMTDTHTTQ